MWSVVEVTGLALVGIGLVAAYVMVMIHVDNYRFRLNNSPK